MTKEKRIALFDSHNFHPYINEVCRDLFTSGHFNQAITEAFKAIENTVKKKSPANVSNQYGSKLMAKAFNEKDPLIQLNTLKTSSEQNEQEGFKLIFMGAFLGIRNPLAHDISENNDDPILTTEYLAFASLLLRRLDLAILTVQTDEIIRLIKQKTFTQNFDYVTIILDKLDSKLYGKCAEHIIKIYTDASEDKQVRDNAFFTYPILLDKLNDEYDLRHLVTLVSTFLDTDENFVIGLDLLFPKIVQFLDDYICEKTFSILIDDIERGGLHHGRVSGSIYWEYLIKLRQSIPSHHLSHLSERLKNTLEESGWGAQGFATKILHELSDIIPDTAVPEFMHNLLCAIYRDNSFEAIGQVLKSLESYTDVWIIHFCEAILEEKGKIENQEKWQQKKLVEWLNRALQNPNLPDSLRKIISSTN